MSIRRPSGMILFGFLGVIAATPATPQVKNPACPAGSVLFAWEKAAGCIMPGTKAVVAKCFRQKKCPSGWKGAGLPDDKGRDLCCTPPAPPKKETLEEMLNRKYPNRTCRWVGTAPFCNGKCQPDAPHGYPNKNGRGMPPGFGATCATGTKVYCCKFGP